MRSSIPSVVPPGADFPFGESPFRVKGVLYLGTQSFFEEHLRGGTAVLYEEIAESELRAFISQRFLPSGWYDVMPVPALIAYEAQALRMDLPAYLRHRTRWQAERDTQGVYRWIMKLASPAMVAARLPKIMTQMFDFVKVDVERTAEHEVQVAMSGLPAALDQWLENALLVYSDVALKLAGASSVRTTLTASDVTGRRAGIELNRLSLRIEWD